MLVLLRGIKVIPFGLVFVRLWVFYDGLVFDHSSDTSVILSFSLWYGLGFIFVVSDIYKFPIFV